MRGLRKPTRQQRRVQGKKERGPWCIIYLSRHCSDATLYFDPTGTILGQSDVRRWRSAIFPVQHKFRVIFDKISTVVPTPPVTTPHAPYSHWI
jgi:hypothetical protein